MSEFKPINNEVVVTGCDVKTKRVKSKLLTKKVKLIIEDCDGDGDFNDKKTTFIKQIFREDILTNILANTHLTGKDLFDMIMEENKEVCDETSEGYEIRQGWIYEALCQILIAAKCVENVNYTEITQGNLQNLKQNKNINTLLKIKIAGGGNNLVDMTLKEGTTNILFSIKYKKNFCETQASKINDTINTQKITNDYKIALIVKDKELFVNHTFNNQLNIDKVHIDTIIKNKLLFDKNDIIKALEVFCERYSNNNYSVGEFIEMINSDYLLSPRQQLIKKLHQKMALLKFIKEFLNNKHRMWCIAHKPRSGKSITLLSICKYLLEYGYKKILIMTPVPATINSFVNDLEKYIDFKNIHYNQENFDTIDESFNGIVFCSVQYLKNDVNNKKKEFLKKMGFDAIITDEAHQGCSTDKTKTEILDVDSDLEEIRKNIKLTIFASGTSDKTKKYYGIHSSCVYEWEMEDESFMKELMKQHVKNREEIVDFMVKRHGNVFLDCLKDDTLNKDYSKYPTQVLMKHSIPQLLIDEIHAYNTKYGTNYGYSCSSLFALIKQKKTEPEKDKQGNIIKTMDGNDFYDYEYIEEFELSKTSDGKAILKGFFDCIISTNRMRMSVMKEIEKTQTSRGSRKSTEENPLLFIVYLPTHTRNNTIDKLQKTFKQFLKTHNLWSDYNIEYSNSNDNSNNINEKEYNKEIEDYMERTKKGYIDENGNKCCYNGCILLLGNKGTVGVTYKDCDVTISLDDGHNLDNQKQRFSRALTESEGKTIGINVDMNVQRTYLYLIDIIQRHRRNTKTTKTNAEILHYLFEHNVFLFDPQQINNGKLTTIEIMSYYQKEAENIMNEIDDTSLLEKINCDDDMREILTNMMVEMKKQQKLINRDIEGEQQHCPKGDKTKYQVDSPCVDTNLDNENDNDNENIEESIEEVINEDTKDLVNKTLELCKYLFPYMSLISKSYKIFDFKEILICEKTKQLIISFLEYKKIDLNKNSYFIIVNIMNEIIENNEEIVNNIREIYSIAPHDKLRELIAKHFIPTNDEKRKNAEVPTPVSLVDEMINTVSLEFWKTPHKVFEPCCGKGNFVLAIFDKFYKGLEEMYPDEIERSRVIMTECIYYADLTPLNVFITTELLKCNIESHCALDEFDFDFNSYTGDTLELNVQNKWAIVGFDLVCGNPPYNSSGDTSTGNTIWQDFTRKSINEWLLPNGYLLFVHPPGWRKPNTERGKFAKMFSLMTKENQMLRLEIHGMKDGQKVFNCGTRYDWYLIEKKSQYKNTIIIDENGTQNEIDLSELSWLPNSNLEYVKKLLARNDDEKYEIIYSPSAYEHRKNWMSHNETVEFKYPCVHSTPKSGVRYMYSKVNDRGHFGVPKVIIGEAGINDVIIDINGEYGLTNGAIGIKINNIEEGKQIEKALKCEKFTKFLQSCSFSLFRVDCNIFKEFKKDFWKELI